MTVGGQTHCDRCKAELVPEAAYCEACGERTRRARRIVRIAVRLEILFVIVVAALVLGFAAIYSLQR